MENNSPHSLKNNISKIIVGIFIFAYFGFFIFPEWSHAFSAQFFIWILLLPIVLITLVVTGIRGVIGLWRERFRNALPNSQNKYYLWVATLGILWFLVSLALAGPNHDAYNNPKFNAEQWRNPESKEGDLLGLSQRERMLDDLMENVLPGKTKLELLDLLGKPDEQRVIEGKETTFYYFGYNIMEPKCLSLTFDKQDIVEEYYMTACG